MQFTATSLLLLAAAAVSSAAATRQPGYHKIGEPCNSSIVFSGMGCDVDGVTVVECYPNILLLKGLSGDAWEASGSCTDKDEGIFDVCRCSGSGSSVKCGCVKPESS